MTRESGVRWPRIVQPARPAFCISPMRRVRRERTAAKADAGAEASSPNARRAVARRRARKRGCGRATTSQAETAQGGQDRATEGQTHTRGASRARSEDHPNDDVTVRPQLAEAGGN